MRVYAERDHYTEPHRSSLNDILKAHWNTASLDERRAAYGNRLELFEVVTDPAAADVHLLTMRWQHYIEKQCVDQALRAVDVARRARKPLALFSLFDYEANFPVPGDDIHVFQASGYRSRSRQRYHGMPAFIPDPLPVYCDGQVRVRDKSDRALVGFCGQAAAPLPRQLARVARNQLQRAQWRLGRRDWEPQPFEHTRFRQRVLDELEASSDVDTRFVLRVQYRAGVAKAENRNDPAEAARREFIDNVLDTDYTVCMRGGGNYSLRFYEALALGRMPVFIDTDCLLPFGERVDWRHYGPWVEGAALHEGGGIVRTFHERLSAAEFRERQLECRRLFEQRLTPDGFYAHFHEHFPELAR